MLSLVDHGPPSNEHGLTGDTSTQTTSEGTQTDPIVNPLEAEVGVLRERALMMENESRLCLEELHRSRNELDEAIRRQERTSVRLRKVNERIVKTEEENSEIRQAVKESRVVIENLKAEKMSLSISTLVNKILDRICLLEAYVCPM
jgi:chromosome segregation ATPase